MSNLTKKKTDGEGQDQNLGNGINKQICPLSLPDLFKITCDIYALKTADYVINFAYISWLEFCLVPSVPPSPPGV